MIGYTEHRKGILFVLSAPSGSGKTTVANLLLERMAGLSRSISHTTRKPRNGETDGVDYHFVNREIFDEMVERGEFLEWAEVHGNRYGTSFKNIYDIVVKDNNDLLLVIDVQGAEIIREKGTNCVTIFLLPPSMEELEKRLGGRGTDTAETINIRLTNAVGEMKRMDEFEYAVVNDDLEKAVSELSSIVTAERIRIRNRTLKFKDFN